MKILLFNLGTIKDRIIEWGIEGFQTLFEQDVILWGPIPDQKFIYADKEIPILPVFELTTINELLEKLPKKWYPDIVACDTSVLNYIIDIYLCPVKTILFTRDSWSDTIFNKRLVELFDFVNHATVDRSIYTDYNVNLLPLSNYAVSIPPDNFLNKNYKAREIDVIAIANYNSSFYHTRYKILYKLSVSNKNGLNIKYFTGIKRSEIYTYYQRSKIVIDWANTLSNRSYEAALNGCLLFSHKDNPLLNEFWIPWEEFIPYDEDNILELIEYYIKNPELSLKIISNAREKIKKVPASWGQFVWENIKISYESNVSVQERIDRNLSTPSALLLYRSATPLLYNFDYNTSFPEDWKEEYFKRIEVALSSSINNESKISPLIEAARLAFLINKYDLSLKYLEEIQSIIPEYAWTYYIRSRIYYCQNNYSKALNSVQEAIINGKKHPKLLNLYVLPVIEKGNTCDGRRVISYMWESVYVNSDQFQVNSLLHLSNDLSGDIYHCLGDQDNAVRSYSEAIGLLPIPDCIYKISDLLLKGKEFNRVIQATTQGIVDSQYDSLLILYYALALIQLKKRLEVFMLLNTHRKALRSFIGVPKLKKLRGMLIPVLPIVLVSRQLSSKIIGLMIKRLKNRKI